MLEIFEKAAHFTMDGTLRDTLLNCSMGVFPSKWSVDGLNIVSNGQSYAIPSDPMDLCNLVHDILTAKVRKTVVSASTSTRTRNGGFSIDELFLFARREAERLKKDEDFADKIWGCIYSCLYLKLITPNDLIYKDDLLVGIRGIDTSIPRYLQY